MPTFRDGQFTNEDTDLYVSEFAEDNLDDDNPFKQSADAQQIVDPDDAAVAALLSRNEEPSEAVVDSIESDQSASDEKGKAIKAGSPATGQSESKVIDEPRFSGLFSQTGESAIAAKTASHNPDHRQDRKHRLSPPKEPGSSPLTDDTSSDAVDDSDPEVRRLIKRARKDSRSLLIKPEDDEKEEEEKMRANVELYATVIEDSEGGQSDMARKESDKADSKNEINWAASDEASRPTEATPLPLMEKLADHKDHEPIPRDPGDDDDIEPKEEDDYDADNYERFYDDDEGTEGPSVAEQLGTNEFATEDGLNG